MVHILKLKWWLDGRPLKSQSTSKFIQTIKPLIKVSHFCLSFKDTPNKQKVQNK